ncbi:MAG: alpha/beta hydrolase [Hyphomicrobiaceae bacterium]
MRVTTPLKMLSGAALSACLVIYAQYRRELGQAIAAVEAGGTLASTRAGPIEYAEAGHGEPLLLIHGAGGGYDQGLLVGRDLGKDFRIIAPSRFGYLKTPVPEDASIGKQADAHAALLDHLHVSSCIVVGVSAGAPSAIEFALRFPERTSALILLVPRSYDPTAAIGPEEGLRSQAILRLVEASSDFLFWLATKTWRSAVVRFLGVRREFEANAPAAERARVSEIMRSILPISRRTRGIALDSMAEIKPWSLEKIQAPTLVVSAADDLFRTLPGARYTAARIPGAELVVLPSGGHLMVGQGGQVSARISEFLERACSAGCRLATGYAKRLVASR